MERAHRVVRDLRPLIGRKGAICRVSGQSLADPLMQ